MVDKQAAFLPRLRAMVLALLSALSSGFLQFFMSAVNRGAILQSYESIYVAGTITSRLSSRIPAWCPLGCCGLAVAILQCSLLYCEVVCIRPFRKFARTYRPFLNKSVMQMTSCARPLQPKQRADPLACRALAQRCGCCAACCSSRRRRSAAACNRAVYRE